MKVKAIEKGFDGICEREVGTVFDWPHKYPCTWAEKVEGKEAEASESDSKDGAPEGEKPAGKPSKPAKPAKPKENEKQRQNDQGIE